MCNIYIYIYIIQIFVVFLCVCLFGGFRSTQDIWTVAEIAPWRICKKDYKGRIPNTLEAEVFSPAEMACFNDFFGENHRENGGFMGFDGILWDITMI